ncbi:MAG TPA: hypothetical protein VF121_12255 [Thermoanaerobaculia bacterium]|nr:hypothetical protein [Thermoanaerobaculia bacterium]
MTVRGESLPAAIQLKIFAEHLLALSRVKLAAGEAGLSSIRLFLQGTGLERLDSRTLAAAVARDDEFMTDQRARWEEERRRAKLAGRDRLFEGVSDGFTMERAEFIGGTLGRWLHEEHLTPKQAGFVLRNVLHLRGPSGSVFSAGGDGPSYEDFEKEARQFETAFERELGTPLPALIQENEEEKR